MTDDLSRVEAAARNLIIGPRERRWTHLSLCVLDAVFSIGARYDTSTVPTVHRYARYAGLASPVLAPERAHEVIGTANEQPLDGLFNAMTAYGAERFASEVLRNRQRTSPSTASPRKAVAALEYAGILLKYEASTMTKAAELMTDDARYPAAEQKLRRVPGNGADDVRLGYLWMLIGDERHIKPDRMVLRWLRHALKSERQPSASEARAMVAEVARRIGCTPWELDHAIWLAARNGLWP